jgi:hypothetical protein
MKRRKPVSNVTQSWLGIECVIFSKKRREIFDSIWVVTWLEHHIVALWILIQTNSFNENVGTSSK